MKRRRLIRLLIGLAVLLLGGFASLFIVDRTDLPSPSFLAGASPHRVKSGPLGRSENGDQIRYVERIFLIHEEPDQVFAKAQKELAESLGWEYKPRSAEAHEFARFPAGSRRDTQYVSIAPYKEPGKTEVNIYSRYPETTGDVIRRRLGF